MNRFDRLAAILIQLQAKRVVSGPALAEQFGVSLRTVYRDLRSLEMAGVPLLAEHAVGYSLVEGYRLPPVLFTREEATALLTAEKLAAHLTDTPTAQLTGAAMDKLRAVLRRSDRDHLEILAPHIQVLSPHGQLPDSATYQQVLTAIAARRVVRLHYRAGDTDAITAREVEPIGVYRSGQWHVVAYCRLRQDLRNFRLDRIQQLTVQTEVFAVRPETLDQYRATANNRRPTTKVVLRYQPAAMPPALWQQLHATKYQYGWAHEQPLPDGRLEMTLFIGSFDYLAAWLLPHAGAVTVLEPPALQDCLRAWAQQVHHFFANSPEKLT